MKPQQLTKIFNAVAPLRGYEPADFVIKPLEGFTNLNYHLRGSGQDWVLRIPREQTNAHIDRVAERHNQGLAAELGLAAVPEWFDDSGMSLTPTLAPSRKLAAADLVSVTVLETVTASLRRLHQSRQTFIGRVELDKLLERYFMLLSPSQQKKFLPRLEAARLLLPSVADRDPEYVPSHNDLVLGNLLLAANRLWLIDWEFSAMASPYWDLATLCNAAQLDYAQSLALLHAYCADRQPMEESLLFDYRNLLQLLGDCWMAAFVDR